MTGRDAHKFYLNKVEEMAKAQAAGHLIYYGDLATLPVMGASDQNFVGYDAIVLMQWESTTAMLVMRSIRP